ncbi:hypothetical protein [Prosthecobacter sp.]|uniref:hypothetical protein n=1 Tax=Prosthecobacter sp. TaxID=1965333 RepID=UPI003783C77F
MSLMVHHFRKEFQYLRLRWFAFLGLLGLDLVVNLEWVMPLRVGVEVPGWLAYIPTLLMLAGFSLMGSAPEDKPGSDRSFISTRPLPMRSYWMARIALWLGLVVVPVMLQNAIYLLLSHRPAWEVCTGALWKGMKTIGLTAWVLPMTALWRRGEFWLAFGCLAAGLFLVDRVAEFAALKWLYTSVIYRPNDVGLAVAEMMFAAGVFWMAWRHQSGCVRTFRRRVGVMMGLATVCLILGRFWPWNDEDRPHNQKRVNELAPSLEVNIDLGRLQFTSFADDQQRRLYLPIRTQTADPRVSVVLRPQSSVTTQGERASRAASDYWLRSRSFNLQPFSKTLMNPDRVLRDLFPKGTLFTASLEYSDWSRLVDESTCLGKFDPPFPDPAKTLRITTDYEVDWFQREIALDLPLEAGAQGESDGDEVRILQVHQNQNESGAASLGGVSVELHVSTRHQPAGPMNGTTMLLYSPERRLVWLEPVFQKHQLMRGNEAGWSRHAVHLGWRNVLNFADGEDAGVDVTKLRLMMLRSRFLGTTEWTWKSPDIRLADHPSRNEAPRLWKQEIYSGREVKAFQERLATLKAPTAESSEAEARRYLYDLLATVTITGAQNKHAAQKDMGEAFRPLMQHYLPLMLALPESLWPGWNNYPPRSLLNEYLGDAQKDMAIDLTLKNTVLADTIVRKGWSEEARRLQPRLLSLPRLPSGIDVLMLKWGDKASLEKLMDELRHKDSLNGYAGLDKFAEMRPRLEALARESIAQEIPVLRNGNHWTAYEYKYAAEYGSSEALEMSLRWMGLGGDVPSRNSSMPTVHLLKADGSELWDAEVDVEKQWPRYRHLHASDFEYLPEQRSWRLRKP